METINLLKFLNSVHTLYTLDYARCNHELVNFLDLMTEDEQFTRQIYLGLIFLSPQTSEKYTIVDGLSRIVSLSLLLHAICECYKKTTVRNEKAIKTIRDKYLLNGKRMKLRLFDDEEVLYNKIINGERLSGHEKSKPMFRLLHNFWTQIKEEKLQASHIFTMLEKINVTLVNTDDVSKRDLYYKLNTPFRKINQIALIDDYIKENGAEKEWQEIKSSCFVQPGDENLFLRDFFITKFNYKTFDKERLYESFVNYFETMKQYMPTESIMKHINRSAWVYYNILNLDIKNDNIKRALINIKKHAGEDTYPYILNVYGDYYENNISESIFIEILETIDEYLKARLTNGQSMNFNELIQYLNTFITLK